MARGGYARAARERAPAKATRLDRPTPRPSGRPWTSARWQSTMRCFSAACLSARSNDPRPVRGASVSTHRSWRRDRRPPPGTRADAAAQTPTGATPRRCARSKSEGRVTHRTSTGSSFNMFTAVADNAELLTLGRRGDVPECDVSVRQRGRKRGGERMRHSAPRWPPSRVGRHEPRRSREPPVDARRADDPVRGRQGRQLGRRAGQGACRAPLAFPSRPHPDRISCRATPFPPPTRPSRHRDHAHTR